MIIESGPLFKFERKNCRDMVEEARPLGKELSRPNDEKHWIAAENKIVHTFGSEDSNYKKRMHSSSISYCIQSSGSWDQEGRLKGSENIHRIDAARKKIK